MINSKHINKSVTLKYMVLKLMHMYVYVIVIRVFPSNFDERVGIAV